MEHVDKDVVFNAPDILSRYMVKLSQNFLHSFSSLHKLSVLFFEPHIASLPFCLGSRGLLFKIMTGTCNEVNGSLAIVESIKKCPDLNLNDRVPVSLYFVLLLLSIGSGCRLALALSDLHSQTLALLRATSLAFFFIFFYLLIFLFLFESLHILQQ